MYRLIVGLAAATSFCVPATALAARPLPNVVSQHAAQRWGLERAWATQVELDPSRGRIAHISLESGLLMVQTDQAAVHVLDAETRRTLWVGHIGQPGAVTTPPAASDKFVVSTNGSILCLFDRANGKVLWTRKMASVPTAGPAISSDRIYVPLVSGMLSTYRLPNPNRIKEETPSEQKLKDNALNYMGKGIAYAAPILALGNVVWGTDAGNVYGVTPDELLAVYRFKAKNSVMAGLAHRDSYIYAASRDGYIYALNRRGAPRWQFSIGNPIVETPMATSDGVYVIPETGGIYKLALQTGEELWSSPSVFKFIAASPTRLYTADSAGRMLILDSQTGTRLGMMSTENLPIQVFNRDNDRIYLATPTGLVQCLHEVALKEPASWHVEASLSEDEEGKGKKPDKSKPAKPAADDGTDPFGTQGDDGDEEKMEDDN
ncbi:MAG TPA: PQQ-binding-like beta-propeller repeat protein [Pirellulales bacterium]|nr:PQQ-binding-like beta-propeller repeat protein [Pirellulales bacterium]